MYWVCLISCELGNRNRSRAAECQNPPIRFKISHITHQQAAWMRMRRFKMKFVPQLLSEASSDSIGQSHPGVTALARGSVGSNATLPFDTPYTFISVSDSWLQHVSWVITAPSQIFNWFVTDFKTSEKWVLSAERHPLGVTFSEHPTVAKTSGSLCLCRATKSIYNFQLQISGTGHMLHHWPR